jgi:poly(A) polymerase
MTTRLMPAWLTAPATRKIIAALSPARPDALRFVGGCVRNSLIGAPVDDLDIATPLPPDQVSALCQDAGFAVHPTGIAHGTVTVVAAGQPFEVTTLRRDVSTDGRRATVAFTENWAEDAARRDFRMNALYLSPDGVIHDPTGAGIDDARAGRVMFIGAADQRLAEDHLRALRFFRFNAWYGRSPIDADGLAACARALTHLQQLSVERVWKEFRKLLAAPDPRTALAAMNAIGMLAAIAPESDADGLGRLNRAIGHDDAHFFTADAMQRLVAFLPEGDDPARAFSRRLKLANAERDRLTAALDPLPAGADEIVSYLSMRALRRSLYRIGKQAFIDRARRAWAAQDHDRAAAQWRAVLALAQTWTPPRFPLSGADASAAGLAEGPLTGKALRAVEAWWIDADFPDDPLALAERLKAVVQGIN